MLVSLEAVIRHRRSTESFGSGELALGDLCALLHYACGTWGRDPISGRHYRLAPAPGALNTVAAVVEVTSVTGISPAVYGFDPLRYALVPIGVLSDTPQAFNMPCSGEPTSTMWLVATLDRACSKCGDRGYRFALLEGGHIAQTVLLAAAALGLPARPIGGFIDYEAAERLHLAPFPVVPRLRGTAGTGSLNAYHLSMRASSGAPARKRSTSTTSPKQHRSAWIHDDLQTSQRAVACLGVKRPVTCSTTPA